jgi:hypothetical protein
LIDADRQDSLKKMAILNAFILSALAASALSHPAVRRQYTELRDDYDWVIVGGGTAGLTLADRLTEAFPESKMPLPWPLSPGAPHRLPRQHTTS